MKKNLLLAVCLVFCIHAFSQTGTPPTNAEISTGYYDRMNYIFGNLELNRVPDGLLRDFAFEFTDLNAYDGTYLVDSNAIDVSAYWDIYRTLMSSRVHANAAAFTHPEVLDSLWFNHRQSGQITLAGLFYNYAQFKEDAYTSGKVTVSGDIIYDRYISGIWQNPYDVKNVLALAPATYNYEGLNQAFFLPTNMWKTNAGNISSIELNAGDGQGYQTLVPDQALSVSYADTGIKTLTFRINFTNSASLYSHSKIHISPSVIPDNYQMRFGTTNPETRPFTATEDFEGFFAQGSITIRYADPDFGLRRPLIVAEGFDPGHILEPELPFGQSTIVNFTTATSNNIQLNNLLIDNPQYDIIYVDWRRGTDDIRRNAQLLKTIIRWVNDNKEPLVGGGFADNVIIGQSMGGLVARVALREMEIANEDHDTRLFVSYDSPQQGANVPLGYQHLAKHVRQLYLKTGVAGLVEVIQFLSGGASPSRSLNIANTMAARQMLINRVGDDNNIDNSTHDQWQTFLTGLAYPVGTSGHPLRVVAVSNGSECANPQIAPAGAEILMYNGKGNTRFLGDFVNILASPLTAIYSGQSSFLLGIIPGKNTISFDVSINNIATGGGNRVYHNKIIYTKKVLYLININSTITDRNNNAPNGILTFDSFPGGTYEIELDVTSSSFQNALIKYNITASNQRFFNFVPTASALDIGSGNVALNQADYETSYRGASPPVAPKNTPFANFTTATTDSRVNEGHLDILVNNGNWLTDELLNNNPTSPDCSFICNGFTIQGNSQLCDVPQNYTIPNLPSGATVTWTILPTTGVANLTTSGNTATLTRTGNGDIQLFATINSICAAINSTPLNISVGIPQITAINLNTVFASGYWCANSRGNYFDIEMEPGQSPNGLTFQLQLLDPITYQVFADYTVSGGSGTFVLTRPPYTTYLLQARVINHPCGTSASWFGYEMEFVDCSNNFRVSNYNVYPNPASNDLTIEYAPIEETTAEKTIISTEQKDVKLFNNKGEIMASTVMKENELKLILDTKNIPDGTYFLHITEGKETVKKQIIIKH